MYSLTGASPISAIAFLAASNASDSLLVPNVISINLALKVAGSSPARFSALSDEQIYIKQVTEAHGNIVGCSIVQGFLKSLAF